MYPLVNEDDLFFQLCEVLNVGRGEGSGRFAHCDEEVVRATVTSAFEVASRYFLPIAASCDEEEVQFIDGKIIFPNGIKEAVTAYMEAGFLTAPLSHEDGGLQLPLTVTQSCMALFQAANPPLAGFPFSTDAVANVIAAFGTPEQKKTILKPMRTGKWLGVFAMSEPNAGSSLGDLTTTAAPTAGDHYIIRGNKMWISGAGNDFCENQIHLVPARIEGAPPGPKGVSLFLVPRYRQDASGQWKACNDVTVAGINKKMGYRAMSNTVLNLGERDDCHGYLVGQAGVGLQHVFLLINEARLWVGMGAVMMAYTAYLQALDYAKNRRQGRLPSQRAPGQSQVRIIEHADVRRMLLAQKAAAEGGLALVLYCADLVDKQHCATDAGNHPVAEALEDRLSLLTPIAKAWPSEFCLEANKLAIQVLGGYGYSREFPMERLYRDARLNAIHEGTQGIQANDLVSRKLAAKGGMPVFELLEDMKRECADIITPLHECAENFNAAVDAVQKTVSFLIDLSTKGKSEQLLMNAASFLDAFGHLVIAWRWLVLARHARSAFDQGRVSEDFYWGKVFSCRYFLMRELPRIHPQLRLVATLEDSCVSMPENGF